MLHRGKLSSHSVNRHVEWNNSKSGRKLTEDGSTTNKRHVDADNLFYLTQSRISPSEISSFKSNDWLLVDGICQCVVCSVGHYVAHTIGTKL